jgi:hypothetical protein
MNEVVGFDEIFRMNWLCLESSVIILCFAEANALIFRGQVW